MTSAIQNGYSNAAAFSYQNSSDDRKSARTTKNADQANSPADAAKDTVEISSHAKRMLARANAERSVVDHLNAQLNAFRANKGSVLHGTNGDDTLDAGPDIFKIIRWSRQRYDLGLSQRQGQRRRWR